MIDFTSIGRRILVPRALRMDAWQGRVGEVQRKVLERLVRKGARTKYGVDLGLEAKSTYEDFRRVVPVSHYADLKPYIMRMVHGEKDVLWPGKVRNFAQSSGTSDGKSKFIPITEEGLKINHLGGASMAVSCYLRNNPKSRIFGGKSFILGGSFANTLDFTLPKGILAGDLSATLISRVPPVIERFFRVPERRIALLADWEEKLPALVEASSKADITNISGVPSWFMTVLEKLLEATGKKTVKEVWPNLEVFFHGGISFVPYREHYRKLMGDTDINYLETYNASEGFFAVQDDPEVGSMRLLLDHGVFYEFLELGGDSPVAAWEVEEGKVYEMLVTSVNGLWRYSPGDTVIIDSVDPLRIRIVGRTKHFINAFGEELMVYNADAAIRKASELTGASVANYTAGPLYADTEHKGRHQWIVEFASRPDSLQRFADELDKALRRENSDYDAKRSHSLFLDPPLIVEAVPGLFDRWLASTGKLGGQRKVPRLSNDRNILEAMLAMNTETSINN